MSVAAQIKEMWICKNDHKGNHVNLIHIYDSLKGRVIIAQCKWWVTSIVCHESGEIVGKQVWLVALMKPHKNKRTEKWFEPELREDDNERSQGIKRTETQWVMLLYLEGNQNKNRGKQQQERQAPNGRKVRSCNLGHLTTINNTTASPLLTVSFSSSLILCPHASSPSVPFISILSLLFILSLQPRF